MSSSDSLLEELLAKPVGPTVAKREKKIEDFTRQVSIGRTTAEIEVAASLVDSTNDGTALKYLTEEGQNPDDWEVTHFRKIKYGSDMESVKFSYQRKKITGALEVPIDELIASVKDYSPPIYHDRSGTYGYLVLVGDMQFGKADGDGPAGTLRRTIDCINRAADELTRYRGVVDIGHVHIAWLGDHIEGFVSQNGANAWRTVLTLNEQIRLTRKVMLHAMKVFAPLADKVTMAAVPGNHGESVRFEGHGLTRYDDSHDTESLIALKDIIDMMPEHFGHVEIYVPDTDELTVVCEVAGTVIGHAHGHKFGNRKESYFEWWKGQGFDRDSNLYVADLLVAGHSHHHMVDTQGSRKFIQVPALESESTWFRHSKGIGGAPGIVVALTKDGLTPIVHEISAGRVTE